MTDRDNNLALLHDGLAAILKPIVKEAVEEAISSNRQEDRLLDADEAARILSVSEDWLYRHAKKLPFARKLGPKMLRFSFQGIQKFLAVKMMR